jgi:hypothetical protein
MRSSTAEVQLIAEPLEVLPRPILHDLGSMPDRAEVRARLAGLTFRRVPPNPPRATVGCPIRARR